LKGIEYPLAISKQRKEELQAQYADWLNVVAVILVEYTGAKMKAIDAIRAKIRETGGEFHIVKNTLVRRVFAENGMELPKDYLVKSTAISFAFKDPASTAKALTDATKGNEFVKVKGGLMGGKSSERRSGEDAFSRCPVARYARNIARCFAGSCWQTRPHTGRTRPRFGRCHQGAF
jgi:ribosomal protein L10